MKKLSILILTLCIVSLGAQARDYAKLQVKEMQHAQKYGTTNKYLSDTASFKANTNMKLRDPKIIKIGNYEKISNSDFAKKEKSDGVEYAKIAKSMGIRNIDNYNAQAKGEDYYKIYRIAEKIIRANKLDYLNWRIGIQRDADTVNAYTTGTNYVCITTALYDTFSHNDDALALVIGHEMGHALLGHSQRKQQLLSKTEYLDGPLSKAVIRRKYLIDSKNMEHAADVEGAKLAYRAGYDLNVASEVLKYLDTISAEGDYRSTHPDVSKRIQNLSENSRYFPTQWVDMGKYNIYNSDVMKVKLSSDRKSIVITPAEDKLNPNQYYRPETMEELFTRFGYMYYLNGEFENSLKYFDKLFAQDRTNASAYLYASYAAQELYKNTGSQKYLQDAKNYINSAKMLDSTNKYIIEQASAL